ncbi:MAG: hypothetical protein CMB46_01800 [Euryarchaeota archaeon]|nr:hypothetical protein [Euryarchaeota archaeon]|tara:strand:+ start:4707 stop:6725 length:2019 start_codon:yes stop_codon:yes gene_type:complete
MTTPDAPGLGVYLAHEEMRESQIEMIIDGIDSLSSGGFLLAAAPTGIGKTAASLASALSVASSSEGASPKIIFMTGRQSQHRIVVETVNMINSRLPVGIPRVKLVDIIGREGMCELVDKSTGRCNCEQNTTEEGRQAKRNRMKDIILSEPRHVEWSINYGKQEKVCSWASARAAVRDADILVCDYNHVFIEGVRESSLPAMGIELSESILIVDEAHNLPDRIRNGLERRITDQVFRRALTDIQEYKGNLEKVAIQLDTSEAYGFSDAVKLEAQVKAIKEDNGLRKWFNQKTQENETSNWDDLRIDTDEFLTILGRAIEGVGDNPENDHITQIREMNRGLMKVKIDEDETLDEDEQNDCVRLAEMLEVCIQYRNSDAFSLIFDNVLDEPRITSHLLDPGLVGRPIFEECAGSILMSGTLFPPVMYCDILGIPEDGYTGKEYNSGFPPQNRHVLIASDVTSKFSERETSYTKIGEHVTSVLKNTPGNVAIFSPSYSMMERVVSDTGYIFGRHRLKEERGMSKRSVDGMVNRLHELKSMGKNSVIFGVLSGKLSEGIDYSDNILDAVVCIGLPLPPPSAKQDSLFEYYKSRFGRSRAWKYASLQPAINSVLQALGRPIRKAEDRAIVVLLEKRLLDSRSKDCMPKSMDSLRTSSPNRTGKHVERFFKIPQSMGSS